jgi:hypothetical protein
VRLIAGEALGCFALYEINFAVAVLDQPKAFLIKYSFLAEFELVFFLVFPYHFLSFQ